MSITRASIPSRKKSGVPTNAAYESQALFPLGTVSGGSFKLGNIALAAGGTGTTANIPYNATAQAIATAVNALTPAVTVASTTNTTVTINGFKALALAFTGTAGQASQPLMTVDNSGITGGGTIGIQRVVAGTPGDFAGAAIGDLAMDTTTGDIYINKGTASAPTWTPNRSIVVIPSGNDMVSALGDSITAGSASDYPASVSNNYLHIAAFRSKGRYSVSRVVGVGGDTTAMMLTRISDVIYPTDPYSGVALGRPRYCVVLGGINDIQQSVAFATTKANLIAIYTALRNAGIEPIACMLTPYGNPGTPATETANQQLVAQLNAWISWYCRLLPQPIKAVDFYSPCIDTTNGRMSSAMGTADNLHPGAAGYDLMGQILNDRLNGATGTYAHAGIYLASCANDWTTNGPSLIPNGTMVDTNADGTADNWTTATTCTIAAIDSPDVGNYQVYTGAGQPFVSSRSALMVAGNRIGFSYVFKATVAASQTALVKPFFGGAPNTERTFQRVYQASVPAGSRDIFVADVPSGNTTFNFLVDAGAATTISIGQLTAVNLTTLGLT